MGIANVMPIFFNGYWLFVAQPNLHILSNPRYIATYAVRD